MALSDYQPERRAYVLAGGGFEVSGLTPAHLATLVRTHLSDLEALFTLIKCGADISEGDGLQLAADLLTQAPGFCANIIALASGEPESGPIVETLPFPVQVDALVAIGDLTFKEVGGVKKFVEKITILLQQTNFQLPKLKAA
jgi:hypothetical protein